jgi:hypothetical protein
MTAATIAGLTALGVAGLFGEKLLNNLGKIELGSMVGIASYTEIAITAIGGIAKLVGTIAKIG